MKMIYITKDNKARVESISSSKSLIEKHGFHRVPGGTIYRNATGQEDAICIMFEGRVLPYGDKQEKGAIGSACAEIIVTHFLGGKMEVDNSLNRILGWVSKNGVTIFLILMGLMLVISAIMGG